MADKTSNLELISAGQAQKEVTANALFDAASPAMLYGRHAEACIGLTWAYYGGKKSNGVSVNNISNGTKTLSASTTNYIECDNDGVVYKVTGSPTGGRFLLYTVVTNSTTVTDYTDHRNGTQGLDFASAGVTPVAADIDVTDTGGYFTGTDVEAVLQEIGAGLIFNTGVTYSATLNLDADDYSHNELITITLTGNLQLNLANGDPGKQLMFLFKQDATGGRGVTLNTGFAFGADIPSYSASAGANKQDYIGVKFNATASKWHVLAVNKGF